MLLILGIYPGGPVAKTPCFQCRGWGSIPGQGTRSHVTQLKITHVLTKTWCSQINIFFKWYSFLQEKMINISEPLDYPDIGIIIEGLLKQLACVCLCVCVCVCVEGGICV